VAVVLSAVCKVQALAHEPVQLPPPSGVTYKIVEPAAWLAALEIPAATPSASSGPTTTIRTKQRFFTILLLWQQKRRQPSALSARTIGAFYAFGWHHRSELHPQDLKCPLPLS
jgi:hypothetical protein